MVSVTRLLALGSLVATVGCGLDGLFGSDGGRVRIALSRDGGALANIVADSAPVLADRNKHDDDDHDRGAFRFQAATITVSSILVRTDDGELVDLDVDLPLDIDVVRIEGGRRLVLPDGFLPPDRYDQVVFVITAVEGVLRDGTIVTLQPPGGGWTTIVPICPIEVLDGETETVGIAFNVRNSFVALGNWWSFQPRFRSVRDCDDD